jgi:hypothetical protein
MKPDISVYNSSYSDEVLLNVRKKETSTLVITLSVLLVLALFAIIVTCFK